MGRWRNRVELKFDGNDENFDEGFEGPPTVTELDGPLFKPPAESIVSDAEGIGSAMRPPTGNWEPGTATAPVIDEFNDFYNGIPDPRLGEIIENYATQRYYAGHSSLVNKNLGATAAANPDLVDPGAHPELHSKLVNEHIERTGSLPNYPTVNTGSGLQPEADAGLPTSLATNVGSATALGYSGRLSDGHLRVGDELNALDALAEQMRISQDYDAAYGALDRNGDNAASQTSPAETGARGDRDNESQQDEQQFENASSQDSFGYGTSTQDDPDESSWNGPDDYTTDWDEPVDDRGTTVSDIAGGNTTRSPGGGGFEYDSGGVSYSGDSTGANIPIVMDLDGDGVEVMSGGTVAFDWDRDGFREDGVWAGSDDGFLVIDLERNTSRGDGDGKITDAREIAFGLWTEDDTTDLHALSSFDRLRDRGGDKNGILDESDGVWDELHVWRDADLDGETDPGEMKSLDDLGITSINLKYDDGSRFSNKSNDLVVGDFATLHGLASFERNGRTVEGGVGDLRLAYDRNGFRVVETGSGTRSFREDGIEGTGLHLEKQGGRNFTFDAGTTFSSVLGDDRANLLKAEGHVRGITLDGGEGNDTLLGGVLDDILRGAVGADRIEGGQGDDALFFDARDPRIDGGLGRDTAIAGDEAVSLDLDASDIEVAYGGRGDDAFTNEGSETGVEIKAGGGRDVIRGGQVNDVLYGGADKDRISGEESADNLFGQAGNDHLWGNEGDDVLSGGGGGDKLYGQDGDDALSGGDGDDVLDGGNGDDYLVGAAGDDVLDAGGGPDSDILVGGSGDDILRGGGDRSQGTHIPRDTLLGNTRDDILIGNAGDDTIYAGAGDNRIHAGAGNDVVQFYHTSGKGGYVLGGTGNDIFAVDFGTPAGLLDILGGKGDDVLYLQGARDEYEIAALDGERTVLGTGETVTTGASEYRISHENGEAVFYVIDVERVGFVGDNHLGDNTVPEWPRGDPMTDAEMQMRRLEGANPDEANRDAFVGIDADPRSDRNPKPEEDTRFHYRGDGNDYYQVERDRGTQNSHADGGPGADHLVLVGGDDTASGGPGDDFVFGDTGSDILYGGAGRDGLFGGSDDDRIQGNSGRDFIRGGAGDDHLSGGTSADELYGDVGRDTLIGRSGLDVLIGGEDDDSLDGGNGADHLLGNAGNDTLRGGSDADLANGGGGRDRLFGAKGNDLLDGGRDADHVSGELGDDRLIGDEGDDSIYGGEGRDTLHGDPGSDSLQGGNGMDVLYGGAGADSLEGGNEVDVLTGGVGGDLIDGGNGFADEATYLDANGGVTINLKTGLANRSDATGDRLISIENLSGSTHHDLLTGNAGANRLMGDAGDDRIWGDRGADLIHGGAGQDSLTGGTGHDRIAGDAGVDSLFGAGGRDSLSGGGGNDLLHGGDDNDRLQGDGGRDMLRGDAGDDHLDGGGWSDRLSGGRGDDVLRDGDGEDTMTGNTGADRFVFVRDRDTDRITDFNEHVDILDLRELGVRGPWVLSVKHERIDNGPSIDTLLQVGKERIELLGIRESEWDAMSDQILYV